MLKQIKQLLPRVPHIKLFQVAQLSVQIKIKDSIERRDERMNIKCFALSLVVSYLALLITF